MTFDLGQRSASSKDRVETNTERRVHGASCINYCANTVSKYARKLYSKCGTDATRCPHNSIMMKLSAALMW